MAAPFYFKSGWHNTTYSKENQSKHLSIQFYIFESDTNKIFLL